MTNFTKKSSWLKPKFTTVTGILLYIYQQQTTKAFIIPEENADMVIARNRAINFGNPIYHKLKERFSKHTFS